MNESLREVGMGIDINIESAVYDIDAIRRLIPEWDALPKPARHHFCAYYAQPVEVHQTHNVTCDALHEYVAAALTITASDDSLVDPPSRLLFGDDGASGTSVSDTSLNNKVGEIDITTASNAGKNFEVDEYLGSNELNGETIDELGIESESGELWNHATTTTYNKDSSFAVVWNVTIPVSDAT